MNEPDRPSEPDATAAAELAEVRRRMRAYGEQRQQTETRSCAKWLLVLALLHLALGLVVGASQRERAADALRVVQDLRADELVALDGQGQVTAGEYRAIVASTTVRAYALPIGLGVAFLGLYFWARRKPVPALFTAIGLYVAVNVVEAVLDPSALNRGIVVKLVCFALLAHAIRSALQPSRADLGARDAAAS